MLQYHISCVSHRVGYWQCPVRGYYTRVLRWAFQCKRSNVWETGYRTWASHWYSVIHETNQKINLLHWMPWLHYSKMGGPGAWGDVFFLKRVQSLKTTPLFVPASLLLSLYHSPSLLTTLSLSPYSSLCFSLSPSLSNFCFCFCFHFLTLSPSPISIKGVIPCDLKGDVFERYSRISIK